VCVDGVRHIARKLSRRATSFLYTSSQSEVYKKSYELTKSRESKPGQFRDSFLGVPGQKAIRMWVPRTNTENIIRGKVVASLRVRAVVSLVSPELPMACLSTKGVL
jgi:hypothetical protein